MTPKKAIIIVLILFLAAAAVFAVFYMNNKPVTDQSIKPTVGNTGNASSTDQGKLTPIQQKIKVIEDSTRQQVKQIMEQGKTATGGITKEAATKLDETINQAIMEEMKLKTPEQIRADEQIRAEQAERDRLINEQIKNQLQNK